MHNAIDVLAKASRLAVGETLDLDVEAKLSRRRTPARLVAYRLPDDAVERARKRLRKELGGTVSAPVLEASKYVLLLTTAARGRLDAEQCLQAYRLRW